jgi:hypothetical protein
MNSTLTTAGLNKEEYIIFLLIYASYADYDFSEAEEAKILKHYGRPVFNKVHSYYKSMREYEVLMKICDLRKKFYPCHNGKETVLNLLEHHFKIDGTYSQPERSQHAFLARML